MALVASSPSVSLIDDVMEIILGLLSMSDITKASLVCKRWRSFITCSPVLRAVSHSVHKSKPWLFLLGVNKRKSWGFDPVASRWVRLPPVKFNSEEETGIKEGDGFLFSVAGGRLRLTHGFLKPRKWQETAAPMRVWRQHPVVCYASEQNRIFVMGGVFEFEEDPLSVELFDVSSGVWEICDPLPEEFKYSASSTWLLSVALNGKIFVVEKYRGDLCCFELQSRRWGRVVNLRPLPRSPSGWVKYICLACRIGLVLAELRREERKTSFRMWIVDESTMKCKLDTEICMPCEMLNLLLGESTYEVEEYSLSSCGEEINCRGGGDLIYVFRCSMYKGMYFVYDLCTKVWDMLGRPPGFHGNWRDTVFSVCSCVTMDETSLTSNACPH